MYEGEIGIALNGILTVRKSTLSLLYSLINVCFLVHFSYFRRQGCEGSCWLIESFRTLMLH